jgi:hypothetical protein
MEILPLTSAEFADSLILDVFYDIATTVDKQMTNSKKTIPAFIWMIKPLLVWYNYITHDSGPCIWMSAKMLLSDVYWNLYTSLMYIGH